MKAKDENLLLSKVADDFQCLRDFGGACEGGMSAAAKFKSSLNFETGNVATRFDYLEELLQAPRFARTTPYGAKASLTCAPAVPEFDEARVETIDTRHFKGSGGGEFWLNWIAIEGRKVPAFAKPQKPAKRLATLSSELVHLASPPPDMGESWIAVDLPSGKSGFIEAQQASWLLPMQLCYSQHPTQGWQIAAHVGGGD